MNEPTKNTIHMSVESFMDFCDRARLNKEEAAKFFGITLPSVKHEYSLSLKISQSDDRTRASSYDDTVRIGLVEDGREILYAFSYLRGNSFMDLMQAISYAAHQLYKIAQQRCMDGGDRE